MAAVVINAAREAVWVCYFHDGMCAPEEIALLKDLQDLPAVLADAENWKYPQSGTWLGCLTLTLTEAGQRIPR